MAQIYNNKETFQSGIHVQASTILDDRLAIENINTVYVNKNRPEDCSYYARAYKGMCVVVFDGGVKIMVLHDAAPYLKGAKIDVTESNFENYWTIIGKSSDTHIYEVVDPSINKLEDYVNRTNVFNLNDSSAIYVKSDDTSLGKQYRLGVNVDNSTIKIVSNKVTGGEYTILNEAGTATTLGAFQLGYKAPGASAFSAIGPKIEIAKDYLVESVDVVKASKNGTEYVVSHIQGQCTEAEWNNDTNPAYIRIKWNVKTESVDANITYVFIRIADLIGDDIKILNASVNSLESSTNQIFRELNDDERVWAEYMANADASIKRIDTSLATGKYNYYDAATVNDPNFATVNKHGNLPAGTKVSDLMGMTISEILTSILFEVAYPALQSHASGTVAWITTTSSYGSKITNDTVLDVSRAFPKTTDLKVTYTPEKYKWTASDGTTSKTYNTTAQGSVTYYYKPESGTDVVSTEWSSMKLPVGVCQFYVKINSIAGSDALDSRNRNSSDGGTTHYRLATDAAADSANEVTTTAGAKITGAWRYYSNASQTFSTSDSAMANAGTAPDAYKGLDEKIAALFINETTVIWLQWPQVKADGTEKLYVYIPTAYKIKANGVYQANTFSGKFDIPLNFTQDGTTETSITNGFGANGKFYKWQITPNAGITTIQIEVVKR